ncbi:MAG: SAM-dependent methyltransferase [Chloroflexi bacterium]|nr:MAG: SAM-dependent methyltransferase [Chloroflexota bacterium]
MPPSQRGSNEARAQHRQAASDAPAPAPRYPELQAHADAVYDRLSNGRIARDAGPILDVGSGNGAALASIVEGTGVRGVALDRRVGMDWLGPPGFERLAGDAARLPFRPQAFQAALLQETWEWLTNPAPALAEMARVTRGRIVIVQSEWRSLWIDSGDPETAQEFTRLFSGPPDPQRRAPAALLAAAGLRVIVDGLETIRGDRLQRSSYAFELLRLLREYLVVQRAGVRARRFDEWRAELDERAQRGAFGFSIDRRVVVAEAQGEPTERAGDRGRRR